MLSEKVSDLRALVNIVAGPRTWADTRDSWLARAARRAKISHRAAKAIWYGEITDPEHRAAHRLRLAVDRLGLVAEGLKQVAPEFSPADVSTYLHLAERIRALENALGAQEGDEEGIPGKR